MVKVLVDAEGRYVGTMWAHFEPVNGMTAVEVSDEFAEEVNHLWHLVDGEWVKDDLPDHGPIPEGTAMMTHPT